MVFLLCTFLLWYLIPELNCEDRPSIETGGSGHSTLPSDHRMVANREQRPSRSSNTGVRVEPEQEHDANHSATEETVTFLGLLWRHPVYTMSALAGTTVQFIYSFMEPILAKRLEEVDLDQVQIGWFFMILPAAYIPSAIALDYLPKRWDKRMVIIMGMICCALSLFAVGPSTLVATGDNTLMIMVAGQILLGLFIPVGLILALPSMVESVTAYYPNQVSRVNNLSSGVFNTANGLGEVIGPMFGAALYEDYGFRVTSDVTSAITFCYVLVFMFILSRGGESIYNKLTDDSTEEVDLKDKGLLSSKDYIKKKLDETEDSSESGKSESLLSSSMYSMSPQINGLSYRARAARDNQAEEDSGYDAPSKL